MASEQCASKKSAVTEEVNRFYLGGVAAVSVVERSYTVCQTALSASRLPSLDYSLNPYLGCEHGCIYCYSRYVFRDSNLARRWGYFVKAKRNIVERLSAELRRMPVGVVGVSTVTDPYQPFESKLELTRKCLNLLSTHRFPVSIQTKSTLVLRDLDLIRLRGFDVGLTITTMDGGLARELEPRAPSPDARVQVAEELAAAGVETWVFLGPIIPFINDGEDNLRRVVEVAKVTGSKLIYDKLNLRRWVLDSVTPFLEREIPGLVGKFPSLLKPSSSYWYRVSRMVESLCREKNIKCEPAFTYL